MKVHLIKSQDNLIKGYVGIEFSQSIKLRNLNLLSDNECEFILANDFLDEFPRQEIAQAVQTLVSKLRVNGTLVIGGTDIRVFCKSLINSLIDENEASEMIKAKQSMTNIQETLNLLKAIGLNVQSSQILGSHYEITAIRN
jgi:predicted SAM-dependent methyltransferase